MFSIHLCGQVRICWVWNTIRAVGQMICKLKMLIYSAKWSNFLSQKKTWEDLLIHFANPRLGLAIWSIQNIFVGILVFYYACPGQLARTHYLYTFSKCSSYTSSNFLSGGFHSLSLTYSEYNSLCNIPCKYFPSLSLDF